MPHHFEKLFLICVVIVPLARLRAMINELAERIGVIGPKTQCVLVGRDRFGQIAKFAPGVPKIVKCLGEI